MLIGRKLIVNGGEKVVTVEYVENFEDIDKIADKLLTEYDKENEVEYNLKKYIDLYKMAADLGDDVAVKQIVKMIDVGFASFGIFLI